MKKLFVLMMSLMMVCSLAACGGDDADTTVDSNVQVEENADVTTGDDTTVETEVVETEVVETEKDIYYLAVGDFTLLESLEMPDLSGTTWSMAGGTIDGVEMTQDDLLDTLEQYAGQNDIVFGEDGVSAQMIQGGGAANGTVQYAENGQGVILTLDFNGTVLEYICLLTEVEGVSVLMVMPDEASALYYVLVG